jgi:hypothetical protein
MKKIILVSIILAGFSSLGFSQGIYDVMRYSATSYDGTARFMGLSGAYGALGADFSSLSQNPAGIAFYRKSEFTITPGFYSTTSKSDYYDGSNTDFRNNLMLGNLGMVFNLNMNENKSEGALKGLQMGFGMNRINNFSKRILVEGFNDKSSLLGTFADDANNGGNPKTLESLDDFTTLLAYNTNLLVFDSGNIVNPEAHWWVDMPNGNVLQRKSIELSGSSREMLLSGGANFNNKLYLGLSLCFPSIRYDEITNYSEKDSEGLSSNADPDYNFKEAKRHENISTRGNGFNLKFGFIYKPVEFVRLGGAFHTRTTYNLTDDYSANMTAYFENGSSYTESSADWSYDYQVTTPLKAIGSVAVLIGKVGLISADYEYVDYSTSRIRSSDDDFADVNDDIQGKLGRAANIRLGAEIKADIFAFRAGVSSYGTPYQDETKIGGRQGFSLGLGVREKDYFLDFSFNRQLQEDYLRLYNDASAVANTTYTGNQFQATLGLRF